MNCPLCNSVQSRHSWMGCTVYLGRRFEYRECLGCGSMYVDPMPGRETLERMYGNDYGQFISLEEAHSGGKGTGRVLAEVNKLNAGSFLDYGCGGGFLLRAVSALGWRAQGIEFDRSATEKLRAQGDVEVVSGLDELHAGTLFDVVHMGDVIEHLTDVDADMPRIIERLRPGGFLIAQGPLEANFNLFLTGLRLKKLVRNTDSSMPPYHVMLATGEGQRRFFLRFGFEEEVFEITETAHPAPQRITASTLKSVRMSVLYAVRKGSQLISPLLSSTAGNRYFYVGRKSG